MILNRVVARPMPAPKSNARGGIGAILGAARTAPTPTASARGANGIGAILGAARVSATEPLGSSRVKRFVPAVNHLAPVGGFGVRARAVSSSLGGELGADTSAYTDWVARVRQLGGRATTWPFADPSEANGQPAAQYPSALYAQLYNAGSIDPNALQRASGSNAYIYVLAPADVAAVAPQTMTIAQRIENALFTGGDKTADAIGLPSLGSLSNLLDTTMKKVAVGAAVVGLVLLWKSNR